MKWLPVLIFEKLAAKEKVPRDRYNSHLELKKHLDIKRAPHILKSHLKCQKAPLPKRAPKS